MKDRIYAICYNGSKIWAGLCYFFTALGWFELVNNEIFKTIIDQISFVLIGLTIATVPIAILRYMKQNNQKHNIRVLE